MMVWCYTGVLLRWKRGAGGVAEVVEALSSNPSTVK
jgi:hypothetical protein